MTFFTFTDSVGTEHRFADVAHTMLVAAIDGTTGVWPAQERHRIAAWAMMDGLAHSLGQGDDLDGDMPEDLWPLDLLGYHENAVLWADLCAWRNDYASHERDTIGRIFDEVRALLGQWVDLARGCWLRLQADEVSA